MAFCGLAGKEARAGPSELKLPPPKKEGFHIEANPTKWFQKGLSAEQREADLKKLSSQIDVDAMRQAFIKHAGPDELMDQNEFERFGAPACGAQRRRSPHRVGLRGHAYALHAAP